MNKNPDDVTFERTRHGHYSTRIRAGRNPRTGKGQQLRVTIATTDERVFRARLARLRELSAALIPQGLTAEAAVAIKKAAAQPTDERFDVCCAAALELAPKVLAKPHQWNTFRELGEAWTRGDMHRRFPDHVKFKRTSDRDKGRLEYLYEVVVDAEGKRKLGDMPLGLITFEHANAAMVQLPDDCKRPAARRQYAQLIARVMKLAVFPAACIAASPLPVGFLPHVPEGDILFQHLYPDEDLRLMRSAIAAAPDDGLVDYGERALFGLSNREGGRLGEFLRKLRWAGIDPKRGTIMLPGGMHRKGGKPSKWQAEPGSIEALEPLRALGLEGPFYHLPDDGKWAERLQTRMRSSGLDREALYYSNVDEGVRKMRGHDTRATYLTLGIASGLSETHLMARTGHTTSKMVHRYDHAAEALAASESGCKLMPLDFALGLYTVLGHPMPAPRRAGWMTLDPHSPEAEALERLALPEGRELGALLLLGPGDDEGGPGGGVPLLPSGEPANDGAIEGELVEPAGGEGSGPRPLARARLSLAAPPMKAASGLTLVAGEGETLGETFSDNHRVCAVACGDETSMFSAVVAPAGLEPARLAARDFKCLESAHDGAPNELSARNPVAGSDAKAHGDSPDDPGVRRSDGSKMSPAPNAGSSSPPPEGPPTAPAIDAGLTSAQPAATPGDPVLAGLRAAAHAAVDRGDAATVAAIMAAIEAHRVALARAAEPAAPAGAGVA